MFKLKYDVIGRYHDLFLVFLNLQPSSPIVVPGKIEKKTPRKTSKVANKKDYEDTAFTNYRCILLPKSGIKKKKLAHSLVLVFEEVSLQNFRLCILLQMPGPKYALGCMTNAFML